MPGRAERGFRSDLTGSDAMSASPSGGVARANQAGSALDEILYVVEAVNRQAQDITEAAQSMERASYELVTAAETVSAVVEENTAATEEMAANSSEVREAIGSIASVSEENSAAVEEVTASAQTLAQQLTAVAMQFSLGSGHAMVQQIELFKQAHLKWVDRLREMLAGKLSLRENDLGTHTDCLLGKWYYGTSTRHLQGLPEFQAIESPHTRFHELVRSAVSAYNGGDRRAAEMVTREVERLSAEVVHGLTQLEHRLDEHGSDGRTFAH